MCQLKYNIHSLLCENIRATANLNQRTTPRRQTRSSLEAGGYEKRAKKSRKKFEKTQGGV